MSTTKLGTALCQDPVLSQVMLFTRKRWPLELSAELKPFFSRGELPLVGHSGGGTQEVARSSAAGVTPRPYRHGTHQEHSLELCLVAWNGCCH